MTRFIILTDAAHYEALATGKKTFLNTKTTKKVDEDDTVILQLDITEGEIITEKQCELTCTSVETPEESNGLKTGWQTLGLKPKEA